MEDHGSPALRRLLATLPGAVLETHARLGDATAVVERDRILDVLALLRDERELAFEMLTDVTAVDLLPRKPRFEMASVREQGVAVPVSSNGAASRGGRRRSRSSTNSNSK